MKILVVIVFVVAGLFVGVPLVKPYWAEFKAVERDCRQTNAQNRTKAQQERCNRPVTPPFGGVIIPGLL